MQLKLFGHPRPRSETVIRAILKRTPSALSHGPYGERRSWRELRCGAAPLGSSSADKMCAAGPASARRLKDAVPAKCEHKHRFNIAIVFARDCCTDIYTGNPSCGTMCVNAEEDFRKYDSHWHAESVATTVVVGSEPLDYRLGIRKKIYVLFTVKRALLKALLKIYLYAPFKLSVGQEQSSVASSRRERGCWSSMAQPHPVLLGSRVSDPELGHHLRRSATPLPVAFPPVLPRFGDSRAYRVFARYAIDVADHVYIYFNGRTERQSPSKVGYVSPDRRMEKVMTPMAVLILHKEEEHTSCLQVDLKQSFQIANFTVNSLYWECSLSFRLLRFAGLATSPPSGNGRLRTRARFRRRGAGTQTHVRLRGQSHLGRVVAGVAVRCGVTQPSASLPVRGLTSALLPALDCARRHPAAATSLPARPNFSGSIRLYIYPSLSIRLALSIRLSRSRPLSPLHRCSQSRLPLITLAATLSSAGSSLKVAQSSKYSSLKTVCLEARSSLHSLTIRLPPRRTLDSREVSPGFSQAGIVPDDAAGRRVFSEISRFLSLCFLALLHTRHVSPSSALKTSVSVFYSPIVRRVVLIVVVVLSDEELVRDERPVERALSKSTRLQLPLRAMTPYYSPFIVTSTFSEALLKFYFQDIPPPLANISVSVQKGQEWRGRHCFQNSRTAQSATRECVHVVETVRGCLRARASHVLRSHEDWCWLRTGLDFPAISLRCSAAVLKRRATASFRPRVAMGNRRAVQLSSRTLHCTDDRSPQILLPLTTSVATRWASSSSSKVAHSPRLPHSVTLHPESTLRETRLLNQNIIQIDAEIQCAEGQERARLKRYVLVHSLVVVLAENQSNVGTRVATAGKSSSEGRAMECRWHQSEVPRCPLMCKEFYGLNAVHDKVSTFEINLGEKSLPLPTYIVTGALSDIRPVKIITVVTKPATTAVKQWLEHSPLTKASRVRYLARSLPYFCTCESCRKMPLRVDVKSSVTHCRVTGAVPEHAEDKQATGRQTASHMSYLRN
ncbi:hypothetical protein PR048_001272 [Dryococelus australis]|uniref:Uncharacterized protein n=1 Tax=Dryococelus australis TaxID=614101 RepID=A0ABQ9IGZ2_9NEOP|nr:hypothetical protein PR048_001272 [Dryococelus australis]